MIWATVSSRSCFCWLYRASPSLAAKNIINLISMLTIWWCPCVESSLVLLEKGLLWPVRSLGKTLLAFSLLHFVLQGQICLLLHVFQSPIMKRTSFWLLVLEGLVGLHRTVQLQPLLCYWSGHRLGLPWYWMVCLGEWTEIILLFGGLYANTAFQTLLFAMRATPFLLSDSCLQ